MPKATLGKIQTLLHSARRAEAHCGDGGRSMTLDPDFYEQDNRALSDIQFRPGMLLPRDKTLSKFLDHLKRQPRAHPSRDAIR
jgi:hypothetical protein